MVTRGSACPELRATQGAEEEVGSLARAYARFAPNFGPELVGNGAIRAENGPCTTSEAPSVEFRDSLGDALFDGNYFSAGSTAPPRAAISSEVPFGPPRLVEVTEQGLRLVEVEVA